MYINRGPLLKIILFVKNIFILLDKYLYLVFIVSILSKSLNNKIFKILYWVLKVLILLNIIFGLCYIIYYSVYENSIYLALSNYNDLVVSYLDKIIKIYNDLET